MATETDDILYEIRENIGYLTLNRAQARNSLTIPMYDRIAQICNDAPTDGSLDAIILTGAGERAFAAGTDIAHFRDFSKPADGLDYEKHMSAVFKSIEQCPVTTISVLHGACTGGGAAIAIASDIRITARDLKFGVPIARTLGNYLAANNLARLSLLIGAGRVMEMIFTSRLIDAQEAEHVGLVSNVYDNKADAIAKAEEIARAVGAHAPLTLRATKEAFRRMKERYSDIDDGDLITQCYMSEDFHEGIEAFLAKRKPNWKGR